AQVGAALAELLGLPEIGLITKVEILEGGKEAVVLRQVDGGGEEIQVQLPAVLTAQKGLNEPRYPSLPGIMKARKKEIINLDAAALGLNPGETGRSGSGTEVLALALPDPRQPGRLVEGDAATAAVELARLLREEAKVI
ncbi:MAG: electron transfer flavoprotein subunit beta, partial [Firmicutes bacterium]|nr:electron transfer flavoprotein subunit beta [Bacillota bacterium]